MPMLINHAEYMNNCEVGRRFGATDTNIERWKQRKEKMINANSTQTHSSGLKKGHLQELEQEITEYMHLKGETGVSFPCEVIRYKTQKLSKLHVMWHQFQATMGLHMYDVDKEVSSLSKNSLPETAPRFCGEVCSFSGTRHSTS